MYRGVYLAVVLDGISIELTLPTPRMVAMGNLAEVCILILCDVKTATIADICTARAGHLIAPVVCA